MSTKTLTKVEKATILRKIADLHEELGLLGTARATREEADALDPPKPTYEDGIWRLRNRGVSEREHGRWAVQSGTTITDGDMTEQWEPVERLRLLADDEIAVKRPEGVAALAVRQWSFLPNPLANNSQAMGPVLAAVADAMEAEADR